jgi:hypothetical protein
MWPAVAAQYFLLVKRSEGGFDGSVSSGVTACRVGPAQLQMKDVPDIR